MGFIAQCPVAFFLKMHICYIDESGTSQIPGNTSHFILAGLAIPIEDWKKCDRDIRKVKEAYNLLEAEIHTGWIIRPYLEQKKIENFESLSEDKRIYEVKKYRNQKLLQLQKGSNKKLYKQTKKNFRLTENYIHLTFDQRQVFVEDIAKCISKWQSARLFAECIDKLFYDPKRCGKSVDEQAFEQVVSRFEYFLRNIEKPSGKTYGLIIHDNNETVAKKHTLLMKKFHRSGTLWTKVRHIIETPLFVDSALTSMVQISDLCAYALRRYLENGEKKLFCHIFKRADRKDNRVVGVRHFSEKHCECDICSNHRC